MSLSAELNDGIYNALLTALGTATPIFHLQAPDNTPLPYVVYSWQGGGRTNDVPDLVNRLEFIRAYGTMAYQAAVIDAACATALDNVNIAVSGWTTVTMMRQDDYEAVEEQPNQAPVYTMGGIYRILLDK